MLGNEVNIAVAPKDLGTQFNLNKAMVSCQLCHNLVRQVFLQPSAVSTGSQDGDGLKTEGYFRVFLEPNFSSSHSNYPTEPLKIFPGKDQSPFLASYFFLLTKKAKQH